MHSANVLPESVAGNGAPSGDPRSWSARRGSAKSDCTGGGREARHGETDPESDRTAWTACDRRGLGGGDRLLRGPGRGGPPRPAGRRQARTSTTAAPSRKKPTSRQPMRRTSLPRDGSSDPWERVCHSGRLRRHRLLSRLWRLSERREREDRSPDMARPVASYDGIPAPFPRNPGRYRKEVIVGDNFARRSARRCPRIRRQSAHRQAALEH